MKLQVGCEKMAWINLTSHAWWGTSWEYAWCCLRPRNLKPYQCGPFSTQITSFLSSTEFCGISIKNCQLQIHRFLMVFHIPHFSRMEILQLLTSTSAQTRMMSVFFLNSLPILDYAVLDRKDIKIKVSNCCSVGHPRAQKA